MGFCLAIVGSIILHIHNTFMFSPFPDISMSCHLWRRITLIPFVFLSRSTTVYFSLHALIQSGQSRISRNPGTKRRKRQEHDEPIAEHPGRRQILCHDFSVFLLRYFSAGFCLRESAAFIECHRHRHIYSPRTASITTP